MLTAGVLAIGLMAFAALLPSRWLAFAGPTAARLRARFDGRMKGAAALMRSSIPVLLAFYLVVTTAVAVAVLFIWDLPEAWRAGGMGEWFACAVVATSVAGPLMMMRWLGRCEGWHWVAPAVAANWLAYNLARSLQAMDSAAPPESLIGSLAFVGFSAFGVMLAVAAARASRRRVSR